MCRQLMLGQASMSIHGAYLLVLASKARILSMATGRVYSYWVDCIASYVLSLVYMYCLLLLIKLKFLIMMTRPQNVLFLFNVFWPCHHYQKFINNRRPWQPNSISHLFHPGFYLVLSCSFFTPGVFWLRYM